MNEEFIIEVSRISQMPNRGHVFGMMVVKENGVEKGRFSTLERGGWAPSLKVGNYEMVHSKKRKGRKVNCLRPTTLYVSTMLIHDAYNDDADELEGCIAPFVLGTEANKLYGSEDAMNQMWKMLGGYDESQKRKVTLRILSNVPGDNRTLEQWMITRKKDWEKKYGKKK